MRVVDVTSFFSDTCGGIKTYYREKARWLPPLGFDCHFVVPGPATAHEPFAEGTLHRVAGPALPGAPQYRRFGDLRALEELLVHLAPDVIEVGSHYLLPQVVWRAARRVPRPPAVVGYYHADFPDTYVAPALARLPLPRWASAASVAAAWALVRHQHHRYRATLSGSREMAGKLTAHGVPRVTWVGLGVDVDRFAPRRKAATGPLTIVYAGRLAREKGIDVLCDAAEAVHAGTGARWIIAGAGPLAHRIEALARRFPFVTFAGHIADREALAGLLGRADVVVAPGPHESFSLLAAEAMACATPVVGADRGGNAELVDAAGAGLTFRSGDAAALTAAVARILALPAQRRLELGQRGRRHVMTHLTWPDVCGRIAAVYREAHP